MIEALDIQVRGIVQGVGFRPFVYRMAKKYLVNGWVLNAADGVFIHAEGEEKLLDEFVMELSDNAPAAARVAEIEMKEVPLEPCDSFEIRLSDEAAVEKTTLVSPDLAICDDCLRELENPNDRRYHYPFINCTNCGPRFTIIDALPYDRANTSMRSFEMCPRCEREYADPADRRFHAQPDACFECGPRVSWRLAGSDELRWGTGLEESDAIFAEAGRMLAEGRILAVKGLGGYHLACDASNAAAVAELRRRKRREGKAFAVMMSDAHDAGALCEIGSAEERVLSSAQRPIVLLKKKPDASFAPQLADGLSELGVMLPCTPVQVLLLSAFARARQAGPDHEPWAANPPMLVMTSGNMHDEPICMNDDEAWERLAGIADAFLGNDRSVLTRFDDSVVRVVRTDFGQVGLSAGLEPLESASAGAPAEAEAGTAIQFIRRARGFAPAPVKLSFVGGSSQRASDAASASEAPSECGCEASARLAEGAGDATASAATGCQPAASPSCGRPVVFAAGSEQKNTFTFLRGEEGFVSQHVGDMENAETYDAWLQAKYRFEELFDMRASLLVCDMHPEYLSSKWAREQVRAAGPGPRLVEVQHHHAHVAAVMAEHGLTDAVCGIAFDGTGFGVDGAIWGGEVLLANLSAFERFANFAYVPMPGGAAAIKNPLRMAYGVLWAFDLLDHPAARAALAPLGDQEAVCEQMIEKGLNTPMTSSVGRLFDAASALLGVCTQPTYEGEGAVLLEACMSDLSSQVRRAEPSSGGSAVSSRSSASEGSAALSSASGSSGFDADHTAPAPVPSPSSTSSPAAFDPWDEASARERYAMAVTKNTATETSTAQDTSVLLFDASPVFAALLDDAAAGVPVGVIACRFHEAFVGAVLSAAEFVRALYGIDTVVLSGGVFMNRYLLEHSLSELASAGFTAAISRDLPPNDGSISLGQAVIAWAQNKENV